MWENEILEKAIILLKSGESYEDIGILLNRSASSIRCKLHRIGLKITDFKEIEKYKIKNCLECGKEIEGYKKFCNHSCSAKFNNKFSIHKKERKNCLNCGKEVKTNVAKYCCGACQMEYENKQYIIRWKSNEEIGIVGSGGETSKIIRNYIFEKYDNKCSICGWNEINQHTGKIPLQLEHIDGNYSNNREENLTLLCPNCHSLTSTYGARNKGNGRPRKR